MGRLIVNVSTGLVSYQRVAEMIREDREDVESGSVPMDAAIRGAVEFQDVTFAYEPQSVLEETKQRSKGRKSKADRERPRSSVQADVQAGTSADTPREPVKVLNGITFRCEPGQSVALLGSTGSGKSSIINLLLRFYDHQSGSIKLDGIPLSEYPRAMLRSNIGIVEQEPFLFSRSIGENIAYGSQREVPQEEIEEAAKAAAIHDIVLTFPEGYNTVVGEKGVTLSGGQRQRVAIARALLKDPRILVLDDATSSVDTETEERIQDALGRLMADRTTFLVSHRIQTVMGADLILVLDKGTIVQSGTHVELVLQDGLYRDIFDIQSQIEEDVRHEVEFEPSATVH
jgi:ATP-binding cassette subfamily B protein